MNSEVIYRLLSKIYDLLDTVYFRNPKHNPRIVMNEIIGENEKILDLCTGTGGNAIRIAKSGKNANVTGIDCSADMLKVAKKKIAKEKLKVSLYRMDATKLNFKAERFDVVVISLVLHEIEPEIAQNIILEAKRVLKSEGKILVMEWDPPKYFRKKLLFLPIHLLEPEPYKQFVKLDLKRYFAELGLEVQKIVPCDYTKVLVVQKNPQNGKID